MNEIDAVILAVTGVSCAFGIWRGLVKEVLSLVTWIAALIIARLYSGEFSALLAGLIDNESGRYVAAFAILFVVVMMLGTLLTHLFTKLLTLTGLRPLDRILGGAFGVWRGVIIVVVILFIACPFVSDTPRWQESEIIPYGEQIIEWARLFVGDLGDIEDPDVGQ